MPTSFQLHILVDTGLPYTYTYVGVSAESSKILQIHKEQINIANREDSTFFETDYLPTSRTIAFDLALIDQLVLNYTNQTEYRLLARFNEEKHLTLTYHSPNNEAPKDYDVFLGYPSQRAEQLIADIYPLLEALKQEVLQMD
jgi:hypothetical protein